MWASYFYTVRFETVTDDAIIKLTYLLKYVRNQLLYLNIYVTSSSKKLKIMAYNLSSDYVQMSFSDMPCVVGGWKVPRPQVVSVVTLVHTFNLSYISLLLGI